MVFYVTLQCHKTNCKIFEIQTKRVNYFRISKMADKLDRQQNASLGLEPVGKTGL